MAKKFWVTVSDVASYPIEAKTEKEARSIAWDWFNQRKPQFEVEEVEDFDSA